MSKTVIFNSKKKIGKVLFIVEGISDEIYILNKIFTCIFDYQYERKNRLDQYKPYNMKENPSSSIFVINTEESNIECINDVNGYLDNMFRNLINDYNFPVDKATIFYIFDRDVKSNTKPEVFRQLISRLGNSKDSNDLYDKPGLLLLSYPCIESFTISNYINNSFELEFEIGHNVKQFLHEKHWSSQKININSLENAVKEMIGGLELIGISEYDLDDFVQCNMNVYEYQEGYYNQNKKFRVLSLLCIALIDLGLIEIQED
jgi:hypothetical protein